MTDESIEFSVADFLMGAGIDRIGEFEPHASIFESLRMLLYIEEDVSYTSKPVPGTNIWLLYSNEKGEEDKLVGVQIDGIKKVLRVPTTPTPLIDKPAGALDDEPMVQDTERLRRLAPEPSYHEAWPPGHSRPIGVSSTRDMMHRQRLRRSSRETGIEGPSTL